MSWDLENTSNKFGVDGVTLNQTLLNSEDAFSGINLSGSMDEFNNTQDSLNNLDSDKRIALGLFFFDEDNIASEAFPESFGDAKFNQIERINLIPNGDCRTFEYEYKNGSTRLGVLKPNNWQYINCSGVFTRVDETDDGELQVYDIKPLDEVGNQDDYPIYDYDNRAQLRTAYVQNLDLGGQFNSNYSPNGINPYGGFYPYTPINTGNYSKAENQNEYYFDELAQYFKDLDDNDALEDAYIEGTLNDSKTTNDRPIIAAWIRTNDAYSNSKCLVFHNRNEFNSTTAAALRSGVGTAYRKIPFLEAFPQLTVGGTSQDIVANQYRTLNQMIKIDGDEFVPYSSIKIKFKMKTQHADGDEYPAVEVGLFTYNSFYNNPNRIGRPVSKASGSSWTHSGTDYGGDGNTGEFDVNGSANRLTFREYNDYYFRSDAGFNSHTYSGYESLSSQRRSSFAGINRFQNTTLNEWETFEFNISLTNWHLQDNGDVRDQVLMVQAGNDFRGRVLLDNFEVYHSEDFTPDVDVRKKIASGIYGKADLTQYYDKELQPDEYKDSQAPLEAQFYFYPTYKTEKIFDVKRTPVYQDFKKGLFCLYNVNWGDGTPNDFTSEPFIIDEETAVYHTYETSGVFEITGTMMRLKSDNEGKPIGLIHNKKFKLRINVNEGDDEEFSFFGGDGFSFIPYKETIPIIGGYSNQSIYYKNLKRFLGFLDDGSQTAVQFSNPGSKIKTEKAILKMDDSFESLVPTTEPYFKQYVQRTVNVLDGDVYPIQHFLTTGGAGQMFAQFDILTPEYQNSTVEFNLADRDLNRFTLDVYVSRDTFNRFLNMVGRDMAEVDAAQEDVGISVGDFEFPYLSFHNTEIKLGEVEGDFQFDRHLIFKTISSDGDYTPISLIGRNSSYASDTNDDSHLIKFRFSEMEGTEGWTPDTLPFFQHQQLNENQYFTFSKIPLYSSIEPKEYIDNDGNVGYYSAINFYNIFDDIDSQDYHDNFNNIHSDQNPLDIAPGIEQQVLDYYKSLPFPKWLEEFDASGGDGIIQTDVLGESYDLEFWYNYGRYDIFIYLRAMRYECSPPDDGLFFTENASPRSDGDLSTLTHERVITELTETFASRDEYLAAEQVDDEYNPSPGLTYEFISERNHVIEFDDENISQESLDKPFPKGVGFEITEELVHQGEKKFSGELGKGIGDCDLTNIKYYNTPKPMWEILGFEDKEVGNPISDNYWRNIILDNYKISDREGIKFDDSVDEENAVIIDTSSNQNWIPYLGNNTIPFYTRRNNESITPYYPLLPRYAANAEFIDGDFPTLDNQEKIPFPMTGPITNEIESDKNLLINITSVKIDSGVLNDNSGAPNVGLIFSDFKPRFNNETLQPLKTKSFNRVKTTKNNGAF